jgi:hypothetical protein
MRYFTLRVFQPLEPARISGLALIGETQLNARTAEEGKRKLTEWIDGRMLERERFYRFEGYAPFRGGRPQFVLNIAFYLFEDGRLCPLRIWHRSEQSSNQTGESDWLVDFNGIPGWSLVASIEPRWYPLPAPVSTDRWIGRSHRDWFKRACWSLTTRAAHSHPDLDLTLKVAC